MSGTDHASLFVVPSVGTLVYAYSPSGQRTRMTDSFSSQGVTSYAYDSAARVTSIARSIGGTASAQAAFGYDAASRMTSISRQVGVSGNPTQVNTVNSYDNDDRLTTIQQSKAVWGGFGYTSTALATIVYGYDNANRVTTQVDAEGTATFAYDNTDQLTAVRGSRTEDYGYDANGNRTMSGYTTSTGNEMAASPGATYAYDNEGSMTGKTETGPGNKWTYAYDYRNRLTVATEKNSGGTTIMQATYTYDAADRRIGEKVDADGAGAGAAVQAWHVYDGVNTYADFDGSGTLTTRYLHGLAVDFLLARTTSGGSTAWYLPDRLGTIRDIIDSSGSVLDHVVYGSYGTVNSETNAANGDRYKFTGREYDTTTGNYFYRARYYGPTVGRFLGLDPKRFRAGDVNLYRYVSNGPTNLVDPDGQQRRPDPYDRRYEEEELRRRKQEENRMRALNDMVKVLKQALEELSRNAE